MATTIQRENEPKPAPKAPQDGPVSIAERIERASLTRRLPGGRCQSIGCWRTHFDTIRGVAKEAGASITFIVSVMQLHFTGLSDEQKKEAILGTFGPADRRITTVRAVPEVAGWIRSEATHAGVTAMRLVAAMVIAWEGLTAEARMAAIKAELRREIDRRAAMRGAEEKTPRGEDSHGGTLKSPPRREDSTLPPEARGEIEGGEA